MKPMKVYPTEEGKANLLKAFTEEKSILGTDVGKDGKYYITVDLDCSPLLRAKQRMDKMKEHKGVQ